MILPEKAQYALDRAFDVAHSNGITLVCIAIDAKNEQSELLFNPQELDLDQARTAVEIFMECTRQEESDGEPKPNLVQ